MVEWSQLGDLFEKLVQLGSDIPGVGCFEIPGVEFEHLPRTQLVEGPDKLLELIGRQEVADLLVALVPFRNWLGVGLMLLGGFP